MFQFLSPSQEHLTSQRYLKQPPMDFVFLSLTVPWPHLVFVQKLDGCSRDVCPVCSLSGLPLGWMLKAFSPHRWWQIAGPAVNSGTAPIQLKWKRTQPFSLCSQFISSSVTNDTTESELEVLRRWFYTRPPRSQAARTEMLLR